jgi:hypothetical protein
VNCKLERMYKEAVVVYFKVLSSICLDGKRKTVKTSVKVVGISAKIRIGCELTIQLPVANPE